MKNDSYLTTKQLAKRLGISTRTLERWRSKGKGIRCTIWGNKALYSIDDVEAFEDSQAFPKQGHVSAKRRH
ncbi:MAG TPA: DNA-binding protein [Rhodobiaceae bacterium]|nr:DNA-binding protein [Rhodobiaceae bacterium]